MSTATRSLEEIRHIGMRALVRELGPVDMVRFLQQFEHGYGDYTVERRAWLDQLSVDDVYAQIKQRREINQA